MFNGQDNPFNSNNQYSDRKEHPSPIGEFCDVLHLQSNERRGRKILRRDLIDKRDFINWYSAAVSLSGEAGEFLSLPTLIAPLRTIDGKWISVQKDEYVIERPFFGDRESNPAWNLREFLEKYKNTRGGLEQETALSIVGMTAAILEKMHSAKMHGSQGIDLNGIPHLNLKPENIIIGKDPRSQEFQVRLSDFLTPMSCPLVESHNIIAPMNFSAPEILQDNLYFELQADIFSCGLILYWLLEGKPLIPSDLARRTTIDFIRFELPEQLHFLRLTEAKPITGSIIKRCLTDDRMARYDSIGALTDGINHALKQGKPATIIAEFVARSDNINAQTASRKKDTTVRNEFWAKIQKPLISIAAILAILAISIYAFDWWNTRRLKENAQADIASADNIIKKLEKENCFKSDFTYDFEKRILKTQKIFNEGKYQELIESLKYLIDTLNRYDASCDDLNKLVEEAKGIESDSNKFVNIAVYWPLIVQEVNTAINFLSNGKIEIFRNHYDSAYILIDSLRTVECDELALAQLGGWVDSLPQNCRQNGSDIYNKARTACEQEDNETFLKYRGELISLRNSSACLPVIFDWERFDRSYNKLKAECKEQAQNIKQEADMAKEATDSIDYNNAYTRLKSYINDPDCRTENCPGVLALINKANSLKADFESRCNSAGIGYKQQCPQYEEAVNGIVKARNNYENGKCDAAKWNADAANTILGSCMPPVSKGTQNFDACRSYFSKKQWLDTYECCNNLPDTDPQIKDALVYLVIAAWKSGKGNDADNRRAIQNAYDNSSVSQQCIGENVMANIAMCCIYGWNLSNIDYRKAFEYYEKASECGNLVKSEPDWWKAMLVNVRCQINSWRQRPNQTSKEDTKNAIRELEGFVTDNNIAENASYIQEARKYKEELSANRQNK
jgi:serine/threonine protein kinase